MRKIIDITGMRYGNLVAMKFIEMKREGQHWLFQCDCGKTKTTCLSYVIDGRSSSCGCFFAGKKRITKHGSHKSYRSMIARCTNPKATSYAIYGGRGISVCETWLESFDSFLKDMGDTWYPGLSIERIDNEKGYSPENCKWATKREQQNNMSRNILIETPCGKMTAAMASRKYNIKYEVVRRMYHRGEKIL